MTLKQALAAAEKLAIETVEYYHHPDVDVWRDTLYRLAWVAYRAGGSDEAHGYKPPECLGKEPE